MNLYGSIEQPACLCGAEFPDSFKLHLHLAGHDPTEHTDASYRRPRTEVEWRAHQASMNQLHNHWHWLRTRRGGDRL